MIDFYFFNQEKLKYNIVNYKVYNFNNKNCVIFIVVVGKNSLNVYNNYILISCSNIYMFEQFRKISNFLDFNVYLDNKFCSLIARNKLNIKTFDWYFFVDFDVNKNICFRRFSINKLTKIYFDIDIVNIKNRELKKDK